MGNTQDKQQTEEHLQKLTVNLRVVKNQEYEDKMRMILERMNTEQHCRLELLKSSECWLKTEYMYVVESWLAKLQTDKMHSEFHILSSLSNTICRQLSEMGIFCWFKSRVQRRGHGNIQSTCKVDNIAFGTLESVISFVTSSTPIISTSAATYELEFQFHNKKICLMQDAGERLFRLEIENRHMHRIVHVVRRENRFDVYFQLQQPPLMYECVNPDDPEDKRRFSRRSYLHGITSEEIGPSDVLQVSFNASIDDETLQEVFSNLSGADSPSHWELRFAWITEKATNVTAIREAGLGSFAVLYASKVLQSTGLRCQLINCSQLLKGFPEEVHAELLYHVAKLYENESEYYLIDTQKIIRQWKQIRNPHSSASNDSTKLKTAILTPTRIIFRRPSAFESNRVFRKYFPGDRAEYVMKVDFRDEDVRGEAKNLSWHDHLDDQVSYIGVTLGRKCEYGKSEKFKMCIGRWLLQMFVSFLCNFPCCSRLFCSDVLKLVYGTVGPFQR